MVLKFERDIVGPALGAFDKTVVEGRHGSWGIYTKNLLTAEHAEAAENKKEYRLRFPSAFSASLAANTSVSCSSRRSGASKYARLKEIRWGSFPLKDFTV